METKFQTSFIPKKPMMPTIGGMTPTPPRKHTMYSLFMTLATLLFIASILGGGGVYAYKQYLLNAQITYKEDLATREKQFNTTQIEHLKAQDIKINTVRRLLDGHLALSQIFDIISRFTIENVRFMSLDLTAPAQSSDGVKISLQGYGTSLSAVAFQSKVFTQLDQYNLRSIVKNPILSNPALGSDKTVSFGFSAVIDPASLSYEKMVSPAVSNSSSQSSGTDQSGNSASSGVDQSGSAGDGASSDPTNPFNNR